MTHCYRENSNLEEKHSAIIFTALSVTYNLFVLCLSTLHCLKVACKGGGLVV